MRKLIILGGLYAALSGFVLLRGGSRTPIQYVHPGGTEAAPAGGSAAEWFLAMKPYCNSVEVQTRHQWNPPPVSLEGNGYSAACYALAGKIDRARSLILDVAPADRWRAAGIVFGAGHPIADAGDDLSAGPIMELVVEFWPNHYMALYHAGMARYMLGEHDRAAPHLKAFLEEYSADDGWRSNALAVLREIE